MNLVPMLPDTVAGLARRMGCSRERIKRALRVLVDNGQAWRIGHRREGKRGPPAALYGVDLHYKVRSRIRRRRLANLLAHAEVAELHGLTEYARKARTFYRRFCPAKELWNLW